MYKTVMLTALIPFALLAPQLAQARDYDEIKKSGTLKVLTVYPAEPECLPRDLSPEDYEMSLLEGFARQEELSMELVRVQSFKELCEGLEAGRGDLAASMLTITAERKARINFTSPFLFTLEQLVTARANQSFTDLNSLAGHSVHVQPGTSYEGSAKTLAKDVKGLDIRSTPDSMEQDSIFLKVASGEYEYTIADDSYLRSFLSYNDSVKDVYTFPAKKEIAWGVSKESPKLQKALNRYIRKSVPLHQLRTYKEDLPELKRRGYIRILTRNNPYSYYIDNGLLMGFEYELARELAKRTGLHPVFIVPPDGNDLIPWLRDGKGEILAACLSVTEARKAVKGVSFCEPYCQVKEQVIGRRGRKIDGLKDLAGLTVAVRKGSSYWESAQKLKASGIDIKLTALPDDLETFEILDQVDAGLYDLTLCDDGIASVELKFRPNLAVLATLPEKRSYAWMVRDSSPELKAEIDKFFTKERKSGFFNCVYNKYFGGEKAAGMAQRAETAEDRLKFMPFRNLIGKYSERYNFHWCLISAQILQESRFNNKAVSSSGAVGLMQIMPAAAVHMGFKSVDDPESNIHAGTKYLYTLREKDMFDSLKPFDKLCFALASYNGGLGHLIDARQLAAKEKLNPDRWLDNVERAYTLLAMEKYYSKTKYGACRASEITGYVRNIIFYYRMYLREDSDNQPVNTLPPDAMP